MELLLPDFDLICYTPGKPLLYRTVAKAYQIKTACYPGSADDLFPSLYIPNVIYIDQFSVINDFFQQRERIQKYLDKNKVYSEPCRFCFYYQDYRYPLDIPQADLLISQNAGDVSQTMKSCLRPGGILLLAEGGENIRSVFKDPDYELLGTIRFYDQVHATIEPGLQPPEYFFPSDGSFPNGIPMERNFCFRKIRETQ